VIQQYYATETGDTKNLSLHTYGSIIPVNISNKETNYELSREK